MYPTPLFALALLSASTLTLATPTPTGATPSASASNSPSAPSFMAPSNVSIFAYPRSNCYNNTDGTENLFFPNLLYGKNNHALVVSYMLEEDLQPNERLDMSFFGQAAPVNGTDKECAEFMYTASPDQGNGGASLKKNVCYTPGVPVTCFNLWKSA